MDSPRIRIGRRARSRAAFAHADLIGLLAVVTLLATVGVVLAHAARHGGRLPGDEQNLRRIVQGLAIFALNNNDDYPNMDEIDVSNATIDRGGPPADRLAKNTTGNLLSFLIFNELITPDMAVSPNETNADVVTIDGRYESDTPSLAANPAEALWDPGFSGTPLDAGPRHTPGVANQSYAHLVPFRQRLRFWQSTFATTEPVVSNRGPQYEGDTHPPDGDWRLCESCPAGETSNTLLFNADPGAWVGYAAFNDGTVRLLRSPTPPARTYLRTGDITTPDNIFVDEMDDVTSDGPPEDLGAQRNFYLRPVYADASNTVKVWID